MLSIASGVNIYNELILTAQVPPANKAVQPQQSSGALENTFRFRSLA